MNARARNSAVTSPALDHVKGIPGSLVRLQERTKYYRNPYIRTRMVEFLGGDNLEPPTCCYLTAGDETAAFLGRQWLDPALNRLLDRGFEIYRSLWDET